MSTQSSPAISAALRAEGVVIGALATYVYAQMGGGWLLFAALLLVPDVFMLGYLKDNRIGALCYNIGHSYLGPAVLGAIGYLGDMSMLQLGALIWTAHVGFDRGLCYGLKYASGFRDTHLHRI